MTAHFKRNLFLLLSFILLITAALCICTSAATYESDEAAIAAGAVARVGDTATGAYYTTLAEAVTAAPANSTITMIADTTFTTPIELNKNLTLTGSKTVTFKGTGTSYTAANAHAFNVTAAIDLTITGNLKITSATKQHVLFYVTDAASLTFAGNAELSVTGAHNRSYIVLIKATDKTANVTVKDNALLSVKTGRAIEVSTGAMNATMIGGKITGAYAFLCMDTATGIKCNISGGTIETTSNCLHYSSADATIESTITGGTLSSTNGRLVRVQKSATVNVTITGGTFTLYDGVSFETVDTATLTISGGNFTLTRYFLYIPPTTSSVITENTTWTISGGTFVSPDSILRAEGGINLTINMSGGSLKTTGASKQTLYTKATNSKFDITGGSITSTEYWATRFDGANLDFHLGGTATITAQASSGYGLVDYSTGYTKINVTGGTIRTKMSAIFLQNKAVVSADKPFNTELTISGGSITADDVGVNLKETCVGTVCITGGTIKSVNNATIRNDDANINPSTLILKGTVRLQAPAAANIKVQSGAMNITVLSGSFEAKTGFVYFMNGKATTPTTVNVYGGTLLQPYEEGGYAFENLKSIATINIYGFTAFNARCLVYNVGKGAKSDLPGSNLTANYSAGAPVLDYGAGIRLVEGSNGIRFVSYIDTAIVDALKAVADADSVSFGNLIVPASYVTKYATTHAALPMYLDIPAVNGISVEGSAYRISAAIVNIKPQNYDLEFIAIPYVKYAVDGLTFYRYYASQELQNARSIRQLARAALLDTNTTQTGDYTYTSSFGTGYSKYTEAAQTVLNAYGPTLTTKPLDLYMITGQSNGSGYSRFGDEFLNDYPNYVAGTANVLYSGYACSGSGSNPVRHGTLFPVLTKPGFGRTNYYIGAELGMALAFSNYYNASTGKTAAILKYADGGTYISDNVTGSSARQGNWASPTYLAANGTTEDRLSGNLYRNFIALVKETIAYYERCGYEVNVSGMFWMQGCSERNYYNGIPALGDHAAIGAPTDEQVNDLYTTLFNTLVSDTRKDIGALVDKDLSTMPVVAGSISESFGVVQSVNQTKFVTMQANMVDAAKHTYLLAETRALVTGTDSSDTAHYSVDDMLYAGQKLGEKFLALYGNAAYVPAPTESDYVAKVVVGSSETKFTNLAYAINTAPTGATVFLLKDITLYGPLNFSLFGTNVTVDGNGFTVHSYSTGHGIKVVGTETNITLHNFRFINHRDGVDNAYGIYMFAGSTLNLTGDKTYIEAYRYGIVINTNSTVNIADGTYKTRYTGTGASNAVHTSRPNADTTVTAKLNITGGNFYGKGAGYGLYIYNNSTVTVTGGNFHAGDSATYAVYRDNRLTSTLTISGATYTGGSTGSVYNP